MSFSLYSTPLDSFMFYIPFKGLQRQNCSQQNFAQANTAHSPTPRSVSLPGVRLRTVSVTFGFSEKFNC